MLRTLRFTLLLLAVAVLSSCNNDDDNEPDVQPTLSEAGLAGNLIIDDVTNNGNASDLQVSFSAAIDESTVSEYRVFVVSDLDVRNFTLTMAKEAGPDRYITVAKSGGDHQFNLDPNQVTALGGTIFPGQRYAFFVLSVADGTNATSAKLSSPSNEITLGDHTVKITYIGNAGVYITDGTKGIIIDALTENLDGWIPSAEGVEEAIAAGDAPFDNVTIALFTHNHPDHYHSTAINEFLANHPSATVIIPPEGRTPLSPAAQVATLFPTLGNSEDLTIDGIDIQVLSTFHHDQFNFDFSAVEHYGYVITIGGKTIIHLGDFQFEENNLSPFNLPALNADVMFIPTYNTLINTDNATFVDTWIGANHTIAFHLQEITPMNILNATYPSAVVFDRSLQFERY